MKRQNPKVKSLRNKTVVLAISGSIAAYKACDLIRKLQQEEGARVICVLTRTAGHFVTPLTLKSLTGETVYQDFFAPDMPHQIVHTTLARDSDLILVCPASANIIARLAAGMADDLPACVVLATRKPVVIVPAMHDQMYLHPLTQKNLQQLKEVGYRIVEPIEGNLACGKKGVGHIAETDEILSVVREAIRK
jgi:phosphopantothenoylcysteine synthetase/decarboxylase